jgi:LysM repeat protein
VANYPFSSYRRRRRRDRRSIHAISAFVIVVLVTVCIYGYHPFGKTEDESPVTLVETDIENETNPLLVVLPEPGMEPKLPENIAEPTSKPNSEAAERIAEAMACINAKPVRIIEARDILNEVLSGPMGEEQQALVKKQLSELADIWLFSKTIYKQDGLCESLQVKPGELLSTIGKQHKVPYEILMQINKIDRPEALRAGEAIKVINGPFHTRIHRSTFTMDLYLQNTFVRSFRVGLGQIDMETPMGLWRVKPGGKLISPTWTDHTGKTFEAEDPDYPLGSRWIGLEGIKGESKGRVGFAIHGTKEPNQIGIASSRGCIRMYNGDVILVYNLLVPNHSLVEIVE